MAVRHDSVHIRRPNAVAPDELPLSLMPLHDRAGVLAGFAAAVRNGAAPRYFPTAVGNLGTLATSHAALQSAAARGAAVRLDTLI